MFIRIYYLEVYSVCFGRYTFCPFINRSYPVFVEIDFFFNDVGFRFEFKKIVFFIRGLLLELNYRLFLFCNFLFKCVVLAFKTVDLGGNGGKLLV